MKTIYFLIMPIGLISILFLTGCATAGRDVLPKNGGMTMSDIYKQETGLTGNDYSAPEPELEKTKQSLLKLTHEYYSQNKPVNQLFRQLPNPEISMYVYPHLVDENGEDQPVPGYTTAFFLYKENHFALPAESYLNSN